MSKAQFCRNKSLDDVIETWLRAKPLYVPIGGTTTWIMRQLQERRLLAAHEMGPSINGGRRWDYIWPNTNVQLWDQAFQEIRKVSENSNVLTLAHIALYHIDTPDPGPLLAEFKDAMQDLHHPLRRIRLAGTKVNNIMCADHASDELRRLGRQKDAALLDAARDEIFPISREYGDRADREGIFAQGKPAKRLPYPKFK